MPFFLLSSLIRIEWEMASEMPGLFVRTFRFALATERMEISGGNEKLCRDGMDKGFLYIGSGASQGVSYCWRVTTLPQCPFDLQSATSTLFVALIHPTTFYPLYISYSVKNIKQTVGHHRQSYSPLTYALVRIQTCSCRFVFQSGKINFLLISTKRIM